MSEDKAELHLQFHHDAGVMNVTKEPGGGYYPVVADAFPVDESTTRVDLYRPSMGYDVITRSIEGWAAGSNTGCPDMTAI